MMPEADILVVWNDGSASAVGKIVVKPDKTINRAKKKPDKMKIKCSNISRGIGWEFIRVGFRLLFSKDPRCEIDIDKLYEQKKDEDREILRGGFSGGGCDG